MYMFVYEGGGGVKILEKMATWCVHDPLNRVNSKMADRRRKEQESSVF